MIIIYILGVMICLWSLYGLIYCLKPVYSQWCDFIDEIKWRRSDHE